MKSIMTGITTAAVVLLASPAFAADRTHQQIMADIRMLQEQQQQLQMMIGGLAETLKAISAKIEDQTGATRKAFADQKLLVDGIAEGVRILREKADDTNVRLSTMNQELEAMRQTIAAIPAQTTAPPSVPMPGDPAAVDAPPPATAPSAVPTPPTGVSPSAAWNAAWNDYTSGQYDLAIQGFEFYLKTFPMAPNAGEAQLNIGNSYYLKGSYPEAIAAYQKVITEYPQSRAVPQALYKLGQSYEATKQLDLARRAYETVIKEHPASPDATLARQRVESLN